MWPRGPQPAFGPLPNASAPDMTPLNIGIIGAGVIASIAHRHTFNRNPDKLRVVAICDKDLARAQELASLLAADDIATCEHHAELLANEAVDTVLVAVPPFLASTMACDALAAGKHVLMEKPMGNTGEDAAKVLAAAEHAAGRLMVAENWFWVPSAIRLRERAKVGEWPFGAPELVALHQFWKMTPHTIPQFYYSSWRHDERLTHGYLIEGGCHTVNLIRELFGMPSGILGRMFSIDPALGRRDSLLANCLLAGKTPCQLTMTYGMESPAGRTTLYLHAKEGTVIAHEWDKLTFVPAVGEPTVEDCTSAHADTHEATWMHFYDVIANGAPMAFTPQQSYEDILFMQQLIDAAHDDVATADKA